MVLQLERILDAVSRAYERLFQSASTTGSWGDVRSTSLVALSLTLREPIGSPWLTAACNWLLAQQKPVDEQRSCWGEELWDTSMALIALHRLGVSASSPSIQKGLAFIDSMYDLNGRHNWHDEPWETSWCMLARLTLNEASHLAMREPIAWLASLQHGSGSIVAAHYTAYFLLVTEHLPDQERERWIEARRRAADYLLAILNPTTLWTGEPWSNGQILWGLAKAGLFPVSDVPLVEAVSGWFIRHQCPDGSWTDPEDTASAILGLTALWVAKTASHPRIGSPEDLLYSALRRRVDTPLLRLTRPLVEQHPDGTTSIHLSPRLKRALVVIGSLASATTVVLALWEFLRDLF